MDLGRNKNNNAIKSSRATSRVKIELMHHSLMMEAERASETLDCSSILTRLVAREVFIALSSRESLKSYKKQ
jgi:hypothetical protein